MAEQAGRTPEVAFHFGVPDRLHYALRFLRKALSRDARVVVTGPAAVLDELDRLLWIQDPQSFLPHLRARDAAAVPVRMAATPLQLLDQVWPHPDPAMLLNLHDSIAEGAGHYTRVVEIVSQALPEREAARRRWREYERLRWSIVRHDVGAAA